MGVPAYGFTGYFRMLAEEDQGVLRGVGVVFLVGELLGLDGGFGLVAEAAIENGQLIVGGEVVGIDDLDPLIRVAGLRVVVLLIVAEA